MSKPSDEIRARVIKFLEVSLSKLNHSMDQASVLEKELYNRADTVDDYFAYIKTLSKKIGIDAGPAMRLLSMQQSHINPYQQQQFLLHHQQQQQLMQLQQQQQQQAANMRARIQSISVVNPNAAAAAAAAFQNTQQQANLSGAILQHGFYVTQEQGLQQQPSLISVSPMQQSKTASLHGTQLKTSLQLNPNQLNLNSRTDFGSQATLELLHQHQSMTPVHLSGTQLQALRNKLNQNSNYQGVRAMQFMQNRTNLMRQVTPKSSPSPISVSSSEIIQSPGSCGNASAMPPRNIATSPVRFAASSPNIMAQQGPPSTSSAESPILSASNTLSPRPVEDETVFKECKSFIPKIKLFIQQNDKRNSEKVNKLKGILEILEGRAKIPHHFFIKCKDYLESTFLDSSIQPSVNEIAQNSTPTSVSSSDKIQEALASFEQFFKEASLDHRLSVKRTLLSAHNKTGNLPMEQEPTKISRFFEDMEEYKTTDEENFMPKVLLKELARIPKDKFEIVIELPPTNEFDLTFLKCVIVDEKVNVYPPLYLRIPPDYPASSPMLLNFKNDCNSLKDFVSFDPNNCFAEFKDSFIRTLYLMDHPISVTDILNVFRDCAYEDELRYSTSKKTDCDTSCT